MKSRPLPAEAVPPGTLLKATVALLAMALIWALNFSIAKDALDRIPPLVFNALRFPMAAAVVTLALVRRSGPRLPRRRDWPAIVGLGILANLVYQLFFIYGLANTRAGTASVLLAGTPIVTGILSAALGHELVSRRMWAGAAATVAGITIVVLSTGLGPVSGENRLLGNGLMIAATVTWAAYSIYSRPLIREYGALPVTAWTLWAGTIGVVTIGLPSTLATDLGAIGLRDWFAVVYAGAFSIGIAYALWSYGIRHLGPTRTATYSNLVPVMALAAAWPMLGEAPTPGQILGAAIIIGGVTFEFFLSHKP